MRRFRPENERHIREIFEKKTGVIVGTAPKRRVRAKTLLALGLAAVLSCAVVSAAEQLSALNGDDLSLRAEYQGDGVVQVFVENRSDKPLAFQKKLKLLRWNTQEELPAAGQPSFEGDAIPPHSDGVLTIDLSQAYDVGLLEQPLESGDSYYFLLTNNNFLFGQDWMCTVPFAGAGDQPPEPEPGPFSPAVTSPAVLGQIDESLRFYFETAAETMDQRRELDRRYGEAVERLLESAGGAVVPASGAIHLLVAGPEPSVVFDPSLPQEEQALLIGEHLHSVDWDRRLLATQGEKALILSAAIPLKQYPGASDNVPLFYLFPYERAAVAGDPLFFVRGRLLTAAQAAGYLVYEDEEYLCYDFSGLFYSDLDEHLEEFAAQNPGLRWDENARQRVESIYQYYHENLSRLICRR